MQMLLKQSRLLEGYYDVLRKSYNLPQVEVEKVPGVGAKIVQALTDDIKRHPRGYAYIVHLLFPHVPLVYDETCTFQTDRPVSETRSRSGEIQGSVIDGKIQFTRRLNTQATRALRYQHYFSQMRYGFKWLEQIMTALAEAGVYDDAIIIMHGDHGPKIATLPPHQIWVDQLSRDDYVDGFSSLFAVKGAAHEDSSSFLALEQILANVTNNLFTTQIEIPQEKPFVYMQHSQSQASLHKVEVREYIEPVEDNSANW